MSTWKILTHVFKYSHPGFLNFLSQLFTEVKAIVKILIVAYLQKCKQLLRFGLLYKIKVIEDTFRHCEEFSNIFSSEVLSVIIVKVEFSPVNCPLSPPPSLILPVKCLLMNSSDLRSNLCNKQQSNVLKSITWYAQRLAQDVRNSF